MSAGRHRIVYVIGELTKGGAEYQLHELVRHLDRRRFEPVVVALAAGGFWAGPLRDLDVEVVELPRRGSMDLARLGRLRQTLGALRPDVLHTIMWSANSYGRLATLGRRPPVVVAAERNVVRLAPWQRVVERALSRTTDAYLVNCEAIADELAGHQGIPRGKIQVIPNGIDLARMPPFELDRRAARRRAGFDPARRLVAQVGRLTAQKDYPTFLRAAARVAPAVPDVDFLVVGTGELRDELAALTATLGLTSRVRFTGLRHDVPAVLAGVDVLALTSAWEGLPNVVLEAMATGAVALATTVGGCPDLIEPEATGVLVRPGDVGGVADGMLRLLGDRAWAETLARAARAAVEARFSVTALAARTMAAYDALLARAGVRRDARA